MTLPMTRDEAWELFCEWTPSESLRRHVLAVEACMRAYARKFGENEERWGLVGMLHDLDYERYPDLHTGHPRYALAELERLGFPDDMVRAVASHADYLEVSRDSVMEKTLFAVDELSGFVMACAYVRPQGIHGLTPKSVKKKMKSPAFAAAVDRAAMREGAEGLGVDFDEHVAFVVAALGPAAEGPGRAARGRASGATGARTPDVAEDRGAGGRRDRPGAARAVDPRARRRGVGCRAGARDVRSLAREAALDRQRDRPRGRAGDARGRVRAQGRDDHARGQGRRRLAEPDPA